LLDKIWRVGDFSGVLPSLNPDPTAETAMVKATVRTIREPATPGSLASEKEPQGLTGWQTVLVVTALSLAAAAGAETAAVSIAAAVFGSGLRWRR
jgi:hypothetical protein